MSDEEAVNREESPRDRFKRLASLRTNEVLKRLKILGNCANRRIYAYDKAEIYRIFDEIEKRVRETKSLFLEEKEKDFRL